MQRTNKPKAPNLHLPALHLSGGRLLLVLPMLILAGLALPAAAADAQFIPFQRPAGAVDATDAKGVNVVGYEYGVRINPVVVLSPPTKPPANKIGPLDVDNRFAARSITTLEEWQKARQETRKAVQDYFGPKPSDKVELDPKLESEEDRGDYVLKIVSYQFDGGHRSRMGLMIPKGAPAPGPAVLALDAYQKDEKCLMTLCDGLYSRTFGAHLVRQGVTIVALDQFHQTFGHSSRLNTAGASVHNISRVISYLETQKELVNPKQIGIFGHIYGAELAQFAAAMEDRLAAVAASNSWMSEVMPYETDYWGPPFWAQGYFFAEFMRAKERSQPDMYCSARQANTNPLPFLTQQMLGCMAPKPILAINGGVSLKGPGTPDVWDMIRPVYKLYDAPDRVEVVAHKLDTNLPPHVRDHLMDFFFRAMCGINPSEAPRETADKIIAELKSGQAQKQLPAARLAAYWRLKPAVPELEKLVSSQDVPLRRAAAKALERCGAVKELFAFVQHEDPVVRLCAVEAIYTHGADKPTWRSLEKLVSDGDKWTREAKWQALQLNPYE